MGGQTLAQGRRSAVRPRSAVLVAFAMLIGSLTGTAGTSAPALADAGTIDSWAALAAHDADPTAPGIQLDPGLYVLSDTVQLEGNLEGLGQRAWEPSLVGFDASEALVSDACNPDPALTRNAVTICANGGSGPGFSAFSVPSGNITIQNLTIAEGNTNGNGGALVVAEAAALTLRDTLVLDNHAREGGGLFNQGTVTVDSSTFLGNTATGKGGGILNDNAGVITIVNSTLSQNVGKGGGGISTAGAADISFSTIYTNRSTNKIGAGTFRNGGMLMVKNSIVANNLGSDGQFHDCSGTPDFIGANLVSSAQGCNPGTGTIDLSVLAESINMPGPGEFGGPTPTHPLLEDDPGGGSQRAIDAVTDCTALDGAAVLVDQRGRTRTAGACDIGAYEISLGLGVALDVTIDGIHVEQVEVGSVTVPLANLPLATKAADEGGTTAAAQLGAIDVAAAQLGAIQLGAIQLGAIQLGAIDPASAQLGAVQIGAIQLGSIQLGAILLDVLQLGAIQLGAINLTDIELSPVSPTYDAETESIADLLCDPIDEVGETDIYCDVPLQALTVDQLIESEPSITLADIDASATQLGAIQLGAIVIIQLPLDAMVLDPADNQQAWCDTLGLDETTTPTCAGLDLTTNLLELSKTTSSTSLNPAQLGAIQLGAIQLGAIGAVWADLEPAQLGAIQLGAIQLGAINWDTTSLADVQLGAIQLGAICNPASLMCDGSFTLGELADGGALLDSATVADLLVLFAEEPLSSSGYTLLDLLFGVIPPTTSAWEDLGEDLNLVPLADAADNTGTPREGSGIKQATFDYSVVIEVEGGTPLVDVAITLPRVDGLPAGFMFAGPDGTVPDAAVPVVRLNGADRPDLTPVAFDPASTCLTSGDLVFLGVQLDEGTHTLEVPVWAGTTLDTFTGEVSICAVEGSQTATAGPAPALIEVVEDANPSITIDFEDLEVAHINDEGEVRQYQFVLDERSQARIRLEGGTDLDLVLFGPPLENYLRGEPQLGFGLHEDFAYALIPGDQALDPNTLNDIPLTPPDATSVVHAVSATLGGTETIDTGALRPGTYTIQVSGYNGATDNRAYALRLKTWPLPDITCDPVTDLWPGGTSAPPTPEGINTVFLYNAAAYVEAEGAEADLVALIEDPRWSSQGIVPAAVAVDSYPGVRAALSAWAGDYCNPVAANEVVRQIGLEVLDPIVAANPGLEYVTIVGGDSHVPFARNNDGVFVSNEASHGLGLLEPNAVKAALAEGYYLTDTPYVGQSYKIADREFFIPIQAGGRLTFDSPAQLEERFDGFLASGGDLAGNGNAVVGGYDFLLDAAEAAKNALDPAFNVVTGSGQVLLSELWNEDDFLNALGPAGSTASVAVVEAHFDESNFAPANADPGGSNLPLSDELLSVQDYLAGESQAAFILSPGCHAALDIDGMDNWTDITDILGNTGFGYGDTEIVALSELLVGRVSLRIGTQTLGVAARNAINRQVESSYVLTPYDLKVMEQFTVYGFPMAMAAPDPTKSPPPVDGAALLDLTIFNDAFTGLPSSLVTIDFTDDPAGTADLVYPDLTSVARTPDEWTGLGYDLLTVRGHAVLPQVTVDVTSPGRVAAGVLVTELTSTPKEFDFDPVVFDPQAGEAYSPATTTADLRLEAGDLSFPASVQSSVRRGLGEDLTLRDRTVIVPARHYTEEGLDIFEIFTDVELQTFYRPDGWSEFDQPALPFIERAIGRSKNGVVEFDITVQPPSNGTTERVLILYRPDNNLGGPWFTLELASPDGTRWIGQAEPGLVGGYEYFVQGVSNLGDVVIATGKAIHYDTLDDELQQGLQVTVEDAGTPVLEYWYPARDTVADVVAEALAAPGTSLCSFVLERDDTGVVISSGALSGSQASFDIDGDGEYILTVFGGFDCNSPNDVGVLAVAIDGTPPYVEEPITITTQPDATKEVVLVAFDLSPEDTPGSGVERIEYCLTDVCLDGDWIVYDGPFQITQTTVVKYRAIDFLGYESDIGSAIVEVDFMPPDIVPSATSNGVGYLPGTWTNGDVSVTFVVTDTESGVASLTINSQVIPSDPLGAVEFQHTEVVAAEGQSTLTYSAVDVAGNASDPADFLVLIDKTDPNASLSVPTFDPAGASGSFTCDNAADGYSPLASCVVDVDGTVVSDGPFSGTYDIDPTPVGVFRTVTATATDEAGNQFTVSGQYGSEYGYCYLYDPVKETSGAVAVKLRITTDTWDVECDDTEDNISAQNLSVFAYRLDGNGVDPQDSGKANSSPTYEFRYDRKLDGYIYNLNVEGLADGPHILDFTIEQDWTDTNTYPNGEGLIVYQARFAYKN